MDEITRNVIFTIMGIVLLIFIMHIKNNDNYGG
jgi:hypothetical protein